MKLKQKLKNILRKLDKYSPYPKFYPFMMTENEKAIFDREIKYSRNYLEFGLGGSSLRAIQKSKTKIFTVESNPEWITYMREYMTVRYFENKRLFICPVNIGPTKRWGYPESDDYRNLFPSYSSNVFKVIDNQAIDLALIDGRFRVACTLKIILECYKNDNLKILIHDFWRRKRYHLILKYLDIIDKVDSIGLFSINKNVDLESVQMDYEAYKFNPS